VFFEYLLAVLIMSQITRIEAQKSKGRFNVYVDGKFVVGLGEDLLVRENLHVGKVIEPKKVLELAYKSKKEKLFAKALSLLKYRPRSVQEIRNRLWRKIRKISIEKDLREKVIEDTLVQLEEEGYLDDEDFAEWWVRERIRSRPRGKLLLRSELYKKGIERTTVDRVLNKYSLNDAVSWAEHLCEKKARRYNDLSSSERCKKLTAHLRRRGFSWEVINKVCS